jgi:hypothetical protein
MAKLSKETQAYANKKKYIHSYTKENYKTMLLSFRVEDEMYLLDYIKTKPSRSAYIKDLIKKDMEK